MPDFSDILLVTDYDHTLTGPDGCIPERNREAIAYFMAHGGSFTLCTGRSLPLFRPVADSIQMNAPAILSNGGLCYDFNREKMLFQIPIELDARTLAEELLEAFPGCLLEIQEVISHYCLRYDENLFQFCKNSGCPMQTIAMEELPERVMKFALYEDFRTPEVSNLFEITPEEDVRFARMRDYILERYGHALSAVRSAPRIVDIQSNLATKGSAAVRLAKALGKKILAAAGDSQNDLTMLDAADIAFVPADASIDPQAYHPVCPCGEGSLADAVEYLAKQYGRETEDDCL